MRNNGGRQGRLLALSAAALTAGAVTWSLGLTPASAQTAGTRATAAPGTVASARANPCASLPATPPTTAPSGSRKTTSPSAAPRHGEKSFVCVEVAPVTHKTMPGGSAPPLERRLGFSSPVRQGTILPGTRIPTPVEPITVDQCLAQGSAFTGNGFAAGRFDSCQAHQLLAFHIVCSFLFGCDTVGTATADLVDIQFTDDGDRDIFVSQTLGNWDVEGDMTEISLTVNTTCSAAAGTGAAGSGPCTTSFGVPTTQLIDEWALEGTSENFYTFEQPDSSGTGADLLSYANLNWHLTVTGGENGPVTADGPDSLVRCDAAGYLIAGGAGNGCIFPWAPVQTWEVHRSSTPESAQNIFEAQTSPATTQPPSLIKVIPGTPATSPLHRTRDSSLIASHRQTARAACRTYFPGQYPTPNTDCDEYPFASTQEGAVNIDILGLAIRNYVVKPIDSDDNQLAGSQLGDFYAGQRIMGSSDINDPFYVSVQP